MPRAPRTPATPPADENGEPFGDVSAAEQVMSDTAPAKRMTAADALLAAFNAEAEKQNERIPSLGIQLDVGQYVVGKVRKTGRSRHQHGVSPVLLFEPGMCITNVPVVWDGKNGVDVADIDPESGIAFHIVGVGTVLDILTYCVPTDLVRIDRYDDAEGPNGVYANYGVVVGRNGRPPIALAQLVEQEAARARAGFAPDMAAPVLLDEKPF